MRRLYASDSYLSEKKRRLRRIRHRACPELKDAYEAGTMSLRQFDLVSRGSKAQQRRVVAAEKARGVAAALAAKAINELLDGAKAGQVRLLDVTATITNTVREYRQPNETCSCSAETRICC
jgi:hypothetical protein